MSIEEKLRELDIDLPPAPPAVAAYQPWVRTGNLIFTSGQLPWCDGEIAYAGKLGAEISEEDGYQAARQCALNAIAQLQAATGDLDKIQQIVRIEGYVHCADGFRGHPQVLNGASDLVAEIFGERGQHTRLALGINEMPLDAAVQLAMTAEIAD
jgi:enamine deaminase RidA (YjgF/YER057c/UK114 family)